jgi:hypothetical protein
MEGTEMRNIAVIIVPVFILLFAICSAHAYVYYVEAESFDPDSALVVDDCIWTIEEDANASNGQFMGYSGPHVGAKTGLLYTLPDINDNPEQCKVWLRTLAPNNWTDSCFAYVSTDGGGTWGAQQTMAVPFADDPDWTWADFVPDTPFAAGTGNVLKLSERENFNLDLICVRNDDTAPSMDDYVVWLELAAPVEPAHNIATTWGTIRSAY